VIAARHDRQRIKKLREQVSGLEQEMTRLQQQHQQIVAQLQLQQQNMMPPQSRSLIMKMPRMSGPLQN
jgi:prefoldin subunit 5